MVRGEAGLLLSVCILDPGTVVLLLEPTEVPKRAGGCCSCCGSNRCCQSSFCLVLLFVIECCCYCRYCCCQMQASIGSGVRGDYFHGTGFINWWGCITSTASAAAAAAVKCRLVLGVVSVTTPMALASSTGGAGTLWHLTGPTLPM